jgi:hypothetical protein
MVDGGNVTRKEGARQRSERDWRESLLCPPSPGDVHARLRGLPAGSRQGMSLRPGSIRPALALLAATAAVTAGAAPAAAQTPACADAQRLADATARGRLLAAYDRAAWNGTDALARLAPPPGAITQYVARATPEGWAVAFGRLTAGRDSFLVAYEARPTERAGRYAARRLTPERADTDTLLRAARALRTAGEAFGPMSRRYNAAALPNGQGGWWVYLVPAPTVPGVWPLGADVRFRVSADGRRVLETRRLHRQVIEFNAASGGPAGARVEVGTHTHVLSDEVEDTDVFSVMTRDPRVPEFIVTDRWVFRVDSDGRASCLGSRAAVLHEGGEGKD